MHALVLDVLCGTLDAAHNWVMGYVGGWVWVPESLDHEAINFYVIWEGG